MNEVREKQLPSVFRELSEKFGSTYISGLELLANPTLSLEEKQLQVTELITQLPPEIQPMMRKGILSVARMADQNQNYFLAESERQHQKNTLEFQHRLLINQILSFLPRRQDVPINYDDLASGSLLNQLQQETRLDILAPGIMNVH